MAALSPVTPVSNGEIVSATNPLPVIISDGSGINVRLFGAKGNDSADDYPAIQAAVNYAETRLGGATVIIPPGIYQLQTGEIVVSSDNVSIVIQPGATLKQMHYGWSTIQIRNADGCSVGGGGKIINTIPKVQIFGTYDGEPARERACGVYCYETNNTDVHDLTFEDMFLDVYFRPADPTATRGSNNTFRNIASYRHDFGLLAQAQLNLVVHNLRGYTTTLTDDPPTPTPPPPHLIYLTNASVSSLTSENVALSDVVDYDNPNSSSIKIKHTVGVSMTNCLSLGCARGFDINCSYLTMVAPQVHGLVDIGDSQQAGISLEECSYIEIINAIVVVPDGVDNIECIAAGDDCSDLTITGGRFSSNRATASLTASIRLQGPRCKAIDVAVEERGASNYPFQIDATAVDCEVVRPRISVASGARVVRTIAGSTGTKIEVAPALLNFAYSTTASLSDAGTATRVSFSGQLPSSTLVNLPPAASYPQAQIFATDAAGNKNPVTSDGTVWRYPDGTAV